MYSPDKDNNHLDLMLFSSWCFVDGMTMNLNYGKDIISYVKVHGSEMKK